MTISLYSTVEPSSRDALPEAALNAAVNDRV